ncbi:protein ALUMINUM SENSITIVE 3-like [Malus sylvestris]|uniref:protein ALUMINUM SENSITIVE 3-like n=1 Tax=Malus sylvestris TaxID=3752 RepID=UPI0021ABD505|nr:protein ALUMINUM SENSITIVE 3-like [Malus sylvestris]
MVVVFLAVALSYVEKLGLGREMIYSIFRAFVQLSIIGFVLQFIFTRDNAVWIVLAYLFMATVAGYTAGQRAKHVPRVCWGFHIGWNFNHNVSASCDESVPLHSKIHHPRCRSDGRNLTVTGVTMKRLRDDIRTQMNLVG